MGLSVGSFFKNAIKGAAQQYNANVAFERKRQADEEAGIKASERDFENRRKLIKEEQQWKAYYSSLVPKKDDKKYAAMFNVLNPKYNTNLFNQRVQAAGFGEFFKDGKIYIPRGANYESANDQQKREDTFTQMSTVLSPKFLELFNDDPNLKNTMLTSLADAWQNNLIMEEDKAADGKKVWAFKKSQWQYISSVPELAEMVAQRIGKSVKYLDNYVKENGDYSSGSPEMYQFTDDKFAIAPADFFRNNRGDGGPIYTPTQIGILKQIAPRTPGIDVNKPIKIRDVANEINQFAKAQGTTTDKNGNIVQKVTAGEIVDAIAVAKSILQNVNDPNDVNNVEKTDALVEKLKNLGLNQHLYNDPQVMLKVMSNALPAAFRYQQNLQFGVNGVIDLKNESILKKFVGGTSPRASMSIKQRSAADLQTDAAQVIFLIDGGAESGASAAIPRTVSAFGGVAASLSRSAITAFGGDSRIAQKFQSLFQQHQEEYTAAYNSGDQKLIKNALLKFYATRMTFRLAADIQNTGGTQAGPRISDDDVARIQEGLQLLFLNDDNALREISRAIFDDAERKKVIYQAYMSGDIKEVAAGHIMQNMQGGDIVDTVFKISRKYTDVLKNSKFGSKDGLYLKGYGYVEKIDSVKIDGQGSTNNQNKKDKNINQL